MDRFRKQATLYNVIKINRYPAARKTLDFQLVEIYVATLGALAACNLKSVLWLRDRVSVELRA